MFRARSRLLWRPVSAHIRLNSTRAAAPAKISSSVPLVVSAFIAGSVAAYFFPISTLFKELINEKLPTEEGQIIEFKKKLEDKAESLPIFQKLIKDEDFKLIRAWNYIDENSQHFDDSYNVSADTLNVPGGVAIRPYIFCNDKTKETVTIIHVGERLCGYPFLIHGGMLFTILDEVLKRTSSYKFGIDIIEEYRPTNIKTTSIELQYRFPTFANNFLIIKSKLKEDGKVVGKIEDTKSRLLVEGTGDFSLQKSKGFFSSLI
jgi:hypothetical protein